MSNTNSNIEERGSFFLFILVVLILGLISPKCHAQEKPYKKPLIERKKDKKGNETVIIREKSCGNHKDKYMYYIKLPQNYAGISYNIDKQDTMLVYIQDDTLYIDWLNINRKSKIK